MIVKTGIYLNDFTITENDYNNVGVKNILYCWIMIGSNSDLQSQAKIYAPSSSLLQGKHLPFTPSPLRLNIFRLFMILSLTQLYRYTPELFLFSTATFKYTYRGPLRWIGQDYWKPKSAEMLFLRSQQKFLFSLDPVKKWLPLENYCFWLVKLKKKFRHYKSICY